MKNSIKCIALSLSVIVLLFAFATISFASPSILWTQNKPGSTSNTSTPTYSRSVISQDTDPVSTYTYNSYLEGKTWSYNKNYLKTVAAYIYKYSSTPTYSNSGSTSTSKEVTTSTQYCGYMDAPYISHMETVHLVMDLSDATNKWSEITTLEYDSNFGYWFEISTHFHSMP